MSNILKKDKIKTEFNKKEKTPFSNEDDYIPESKEKFFKNSTKRGNITDKKIPQIEVTITERKNINPLKDSYHSNNNNESNDNTSVDIKTDFGKENIIIRDNYIFSNHLSGLNDLFNNNYNAKIAAPTPIGIKTPQSLTDKDITPKEEKKSIENNNSKIDFSFENKLNENNKTPERIIINEINGSEDSSLNINCEREMFMKELMLFKKFEFERKYDLIRKNEIHHTKIIYNNKECILLLKNNFLYILKIKNESEGSHETKENKNNPDESLINQLKKDEFLKDTDINKLKFEYEISHPMFCINFNLMSCRMLLNRNNIKGNNKKYEIQILILGTSTKFSFFFKNYEVYKKYVYVIGSKINNSEGNLRNTLGVSLRGKDFYKDVYISVADFESIAKTGDLLLFRTMDCISDCQRVFTRDQYDHIALIIKRNGIIELLEATYTDNCNLLEWKSFKYRLFNLVFKKIVLRQLNIEEEEQQKLKEIKERIEEKTNEFLEVINKKKYIMSILKMAIDRQPEEYEIKGEWGKAEGYCCSALTAAFYIYNGVMKLEKSVHCIRPGDFEQDKNRMHILPGFSIGPEKILEFSL